MKISINVHEGIERASPLIPPSTLGASRGGGNHRDLLRPRSRFPIEISPLFHSRPRSVLRGDAIDIFTEGIDGVRRHPTPSPLGLCVCVCVREREGETGRERASAHNDVGCDGEGAGAFHRRTWTIQGVPQARRVGHQGQARREAAHPSQEGRRKDPRRQAHRKVLCAGRRAQAAAQARDPETHEAEVRPGSIRRRRKPTWRENERTKEGAKRTGEEHTPLAMAETLVEKRRADERMRADGIDNDALDERTGRESGLPSRQERC